MKTTSSYLTKNFTPFIILLVLFLAAILVGFVAVYYNEIFLAGIKFARYNFNQNPWLVFITTPLLFLIAAGLCKFIAPKASGSGPEHVAVALEILHHNDGNKHKTIDEIKEYLSFKVLLVKIVSSVICIAGGGALGREGPVIQISASIFFIIHEKIKNYIKVYDLRSWVIAGSAAGLAAAFNTPIAGIMFAIEEFALFKNTSNSSQIKNKVFFAVIVSGVTAQLITGSYVLFEFEPMHFIWQLKLILTLLLLATISGILAFALKTLCSKTTKIHQKFSGKFWFVIPLIAGLVVATTSYIVGVNSFGAGLFMVNEIVQKTAYTVPVSEIIGRFINVIATYASGAAGGLLLPALALGAGIGTFGNLILPEIDSRIFVTTSMAAFLGALLNAPLTAAILVMEITGQRELILPLFMATMIASWCFGGLMARKSG